jgi:H+/gluconate symporter-like permease
MDLFICLAALGTLIFLAYRGYSVILVAPLVAMAAVLLTQPSGVAPAFSGLFMEKAASFIKNYFPVFLLGSVFGKLIEVSGAARAIVAVITRAFGPRHAILAITLVGMILTYGGVSIYVVVFAVYPFAAEMFRTADIPKRLIPATIAFSALTVTMDALPGTPQIQNIIPTTFFRTTAYAAPMLGIIASIFSFALCYAYLDLQRRKAAAAGEGYGSGHINEPETSEDAKPMPLALALLPLVLVGVGNRVALSVINGSYGETATAILSPRMAGAPLTQEVKANAALWAVEVALLLGIVAISIIAWSTLKPRLAALTQVAVSGSLLAGMNTASEYGFGAIIAALPGFHIIADALGKIGNPLLNLALTTNILSGMTGSASGGLSLTLGAFSDRFIQLAVDHHIPLEVMHRIASLASGGMDTLPHNGAIVTLLAVCGMTHRQSYKQIFGLTLLKTLTAFFAIGVYYLTGLV